MYARLVSMEKTGGCRRRLEMMLHCADVLTWRNGLLTRLGAEDRAETGCGTIAAISRNNRSQRLVTLAWTVLARAPCVAQDGRGGSDSKYQHDGENRESPHGDRCQALEQDKRQFWSARTWGIPRLVEKTVRDFARLCVKLRVG